MLNGSILFHLFISYILSAMPFLQELRSENAILLQTSVNYSKQRDPNVTYTIGRITGYHFQESSSVFCFTSSALRLSTEEKNCLSFYFLTVPKLKEKQKHDISVPSVLCLFYLFRNLRMIYKPEIILPHWGMG